MHNKIKILFLANTSWYLYNFKSPLFNALDKDKYEILLVAPNDSYTHFLKKLDFSFIDWDLNRSSLNPFSSFYSIVNLFFIYKNFSPDIVHHFTIKPCFYGSIIANLTRVKTVVNSFTGLGQLYFMSKKKYSPIKILTFYIYRIILSTRNSIAVCQNKSDLYELEKISKRKLCNSVIIPGSGVDTKYFKRNKTKLAFNCEPNILFPARLIKEKGYSELIQACEILWKEKYTFNLVIAGAIDYGNNSFISQVELNTLKTNPRIKLVGHVNDMKTVFENADLVVLPSWREGLSKSLIEAASMECPIITTDVPGCNDIIDDRVSGLLVPVNNSIELKNAISFLLNNVNIALDLGRNARKKSKLFFDISLINRMTIDIYNTF